MIQSRRLALLMMVGFLWPAGVQAQSEYCALTMGRRAADGDIRADGIYLQPSAQVALDQSARRLGASGYGYIDGRAMYDGAVALGIYRTSWGEMRYVFGADTSALGAVYQVLDAIGGPANLWPQYPQWIQFVRCNNSAYIQPQQLQQITWGNNLTSRWAGYQPTGIQIDGTGHLGWFVMGRVETPPPVPRGPGSAPFMGLIGCWQQFDYANNPVNGNNPSVIRGAATNSSGVMTWEANYVYQQRMQGAQFAFSIDAQANPTNPTVFAGRHRMPDGGIVKNWFTIAGNEIRTTHLANDLKFVWRRVQCPQ